MKKSISIIFVCVLLISSIFTGKIIADDSTQGVVKAVLNGLEITLDHQTGNIIGLNYPGPGKMLQAEPTEAAIIEMAYPIEKFEMLRLASRFSEGAKITKTADTVTIQWERFGASREVFEQPGSVSATVTLKASGDGKSIIMEATIENHSETAVRQVFFPDFMGLLPFAGKDLTMYISPGVNTAAARYPFVSLAAKADRNWCGFYGTHSPFIKFESGGLLNSMYLRWGDFGSYNGGMSLFPKRWGRDKRAITMLQFSPKTDKLRWMCAHNVDIQKGQKWQSGEYILTPHKAGWAKGMEPYRQWVKQNCDRRYPLPKHVREGLGFRSIWMSQFQPHDPQDAIWKFSEVPTVAKEAKEHGLNDLILWGWQEIFALPLDGVPYPHLGTKQDMIKAVKQCREMGVNVVPFITTLEVREEDAHKYKVTDTDFGGWTYHTEAYPLMRPLYARKFKTKKVDMNDKVWQEEVLQSITNLKDCGINSVCWDQYWNEPDQNMVELSKEILDILKKDSPEGSFGGEETYNWEEDSAFLDYTWNWVTKDHVYLNSAFSAPRANLNIEHSPLQVKVAFADNVYMNVFTSKRGFVNGSAYITEYPEFSKAIKQCAGLRKQFLEYFTEGTLIGDCILTQPCQEAHVSAYVLPDKVLMILVNTAAKRKVNFNCDLEPWLKSSSDKYQVKVYNTDGKLTKSRNLGNSIWKGKTRSMNHLDIALFEFAAK